MPKILLAFLLLLLYKNNTAQRAGATKTKTTDTTAKDPGGAGFSFGKVGKISVADMASECMNKKLLTVLDIAKGFKEAQPIKVSSVIDHPGHVKHTVGDNGMMVYFDELALCFFVHGPIALRYASIGAENSEIGFPAEEEVVFPAGKLSQRFQRGSIFYDMQSRQTFLISGDIHVKYVAMGLLNSVLKYPESDWLPVRGQNVVYAQKFAGGTFWGTREEAFLVYGAVGAVWTKEMHGLPLSDLKATVVPQVESQLFQKGIMIKSVKTGLHFVPTVLSKKWNELGGIGNANIGLPIDDAIVRGEDIVQSFEKGMMASRSGRVSFEPNEGNATPGPTAPRQPIRIPGKK